MVGAYRDKTAIFKQARDNTLKTTFRRDGGASNTGLGGAKGKEKMIEMYSLTQNAEKATGFFLQILFIII